MPQIVLCFHLKVTLTSLYHTDYTLEGVKRDQLTIHCVSKYVHTHNKKVYFQNYISNPCICSLFLLFNRMILLFLPLKSISCPALRELSPRFKIFRVCVRHCGVFYEAIPVDAVVWILINPFVSPGDPTDNLLLAPVTNEAENEKTQEEEDDDCYRYENCYQNTIVQSFNNSWRLNFCFCITHDWPSLTGTSPAGN